MHEVSKARRKIGLQTFIASILILIGTFLFTASVLRAEPFVFVSLPDTQIYSEDRFPGDGRIPAVTDTRGTAAIFTDQTRWIANNADELGIRYVGHLGDIVQNGSNLDEWARAKESMNLLLDADIPHGTVMGNHDDNHGGNYMQNYLDHFGPQVFEGRPWYVASSPGGGANFQLLEHEGKKIGFLNFSIDQPQSEIDWANQIIELHPNVIFIIGTHRYLYDFKLASGRYGETVNSPFGPLKIQENFEDGVVTPNTGEDLFNELVSQHPNIVMIHAGHFHSEWLRLDGKNSAEQTVIQILTDYQSTRNGGDGWLRIYKIDFDNNKFEFETYSPTLDRYRTTIDHFVETIHVAYAERDQVMAALGFSEAEYFALLESLRDIPEVPNGFLYFHPDFKHPAQQAYYNQYLSDLFHGKIPEGFEDIAAWEGLWLQAFAKDPRDPLNFDDWVRSPRGTVDVDYSAYYTPLETICSTLGNVRRPSRLDLDIFTFSGKADEDITVRLGTDPFMLNSEANATLMVMDRIRGVRLFEMDRGPLPKDIFLTLPAAGEFMIMVSEQHEFAQGEPYSGGYCLSLEAAPEIRGSLEATRWVE